MRSIVLFAYLACCLASVATAGQFNPLLSVGDPAPAWKDLVGVDDQKHALEDLMERQAVVVAFTCNSCPYAVDVEDRLIALARKFESQGVAVVAINVNKVAEDDFPAMKAKAQTKAFPFAYLYDPTQQIAKDFGAGNTPEFFVLDRERKIAYMGSLDDSPDGKNVTKTFVQDALSALIAGEQPKVQETVPIGCRIRFERERRTRRVNK